jgi:hypothetical protein
MKYISAIAVTALIIIVPFGSWYYLQTGMDYRRALNEEVAPKGSIDQYVAGIDLKGQTTVLAKPITRSGLKDSVTQFYEQYEGAPTFVFMEQGLSGTPMGERHLALPDSLSITWPEGVNFMAVDTSGAVRATYTNSKESITKMIEHMAILLPRPSNKDVKMRNGKDVDAKPSFMKKED